MTAGQLPYGTEQPPSWMTPQWGAPPASPAPNADDGPPQARTGLVVLVTVLVELVLIGGAANQWVSKQIRDDITNLSFWHLFEQSWLTFQWRFTPHSGQARTWGSELALIGVTILLSALLVWVLVRGAITFWRAFFGTWLAVVGAALVAAFVRGLIDTSGFASIGSSSSPGRFTRAVYGPLGPSQLVVVGGFVLGLVTALVVGLIAVKTRRPVAGVVGVGPGAQAPDATPEQPPPYYGEHPSGAPAAPPAAPWQDQHFEPRGRHSHSSPPGATSDQPTAAYRPASGDQPPFYQPAPPPPAYQGGGYRPANEPTTQFPRPPDDEDPHHQ